MDSYHSIIHQNLVLLTKVFRNLDMENKLQKGMFKKPSTKGMQSVFYSLMFIVNPEYCRKCVPWPISFSSDNYKFRTCVIEFINKECPDFEVPTLLPSLLNKVEGEKYVRFVFNFVTYITQKILALKFGEVTLQKPNPCITYEENLNILDDVIVSTHADFDQKISEHRNFIEKTRILIDASANELRTKLREYQNQRQSMYADMKDVLSYTNITEESVLDCIFQSYEDELMELKIQLNSLKCSVTSKLERKEYLMRLIKLKQKVRSNLFDVDLFKSYVNENLARQIQVPLPTLLSSLFMNRGDTTVIRLDRFLHFGRLAIQKQMERFLKMNPTDQQLAVYQSVDSLLSSTMKRLEIFKSLNIKLDAVISETVRKDIQLEFQRSGDDGSDPYVNAFLALKKLDNYLPQLRIPIVERPMLVDFRKEEDDADPVARMRKRLQLVDR